MINTINMQTNMIKLKTKTSRSTINSSCTKMEMKEMMRMMLCLSSINNIFSKALESVVAKFVNQWCTLYWLEEMQIQMTLSVSMVSIVSFWDMKEDRSSQRLSMKMVSWLIKKCSKDHRIQIWLTIVMGWMELLNKRLICSNSTHNNNSWDNLKYTKQVMNINKSNS